VVSFKKNPAGWIKLTWRDKYKYDVNKSYVKLHLSVKLRPTELLKLILNLNFPGCRFSRAARFLIHLMVRARQRRCTRIWEVSVSIKDSNRFV